MAAQTFASCKEAPHTTQSTPPPRSALTATLAAGLHDILARSPKTKKAGISHVQIGWRELYSPETTGVDPRARARSKEEAAKLAMEIFRRAKAGEPFDKLMDQYSEDQWKVKMYEASGENNLALPLVELGERLDAGEIGLTETTLGFHVVKRVQ
jgi:hypothetical protein